MRAKTIIQKNNTRLKNTCMSGACLVLLPYIFESFPFYISSESKTINQSWRVVEKELRIKFYCLESVLWFINIILGTSYFSVEQKRLNNGKLFLIFFSTIEGWLANYSTLLQNVEIFLKKLRRYPFHLKKDFLEC